MKIIKQEEYEVAEIKPIILGGDPIDEKNKMKIDRKKHIEYVRYWNRIIREINLTIAST